MNDETRPANHVVAVSGYMRRASSARFFSTVLGFGYCLFAAAASAQITGPNELAIQAPARVWTSPPPGDFKRGAALYQDKCTACHAIDSNKTGPAHRGVFGRRVGSLPGYRYSEELTRSRLRWTPQTLNLWLEDPEELVAGQRMGFQVESAQERADLIAYLATLK